MGKREIRQDLLREWGEQKRKDHESHDKANAEREERFFKANYAEEFGHGLEGSYDDPLTGERVTDLDGEVRATIFWAKLLKIENPVVENKTTLVDLARRIYYEWERMGFYLFNPYSNAFSDSWKFYPRGGTFAKSYDPFPGADGLLLKSSDFADPVAKDVSTDIPKKSDAEQEREIMQRIRDKSLPVFFSASSGVADVKD